MTYRKAGALRAIDNRPYGCKECIGFSSGTLISGREINKHMTS